MIVGLPLASLAGSMFGGDFSVAPIVSSFPERADEIVRAVD